MLCFTHMFIKAIKPYSNVSWQISICAIVLLPLASLLAGEADVVSAEASCTSSVDCAFIVTVAHADEGWGHYADRWEILDLEGRLIDVRILHHPHVDEQPFTRRLNNVRLPQGTEQVLIRANDSVHGLGGKTITIDIR